MHQQRVQDLAFLLLSGATALVERRSRRQRVESQHPIATAARLKRQICQSGCKAIMRLPVGIDIQLAHVLMSDNLI